jgi:hypothetical protein
MGLPNYKINNQPKFICRSDTALKQPDGLNQEEDKKLEEVYERYYSGLDRFELSHIEQYIDYNKKPIIFHLKRLPLHLYNDVCSFPFCSREDRTHKLSKAFVNGIIKIENYDGKLDDAKEDIPPDVIWEVGAAVIELSHGLKDVEKK